MNKNKPINASFDDQPMNSFHIKMRQNNGTIEKAIFIDGELLDWAVDISSLMEAKQMGPQFFKAAKKDIQRHFLESVSEVLDRKVTIKDIKQAIQTGWI